MPPDGMVAKLPENQRSRTPLAFKTLEELHPDKFLKLSLILSDSSNWVDITSDDEGDIEEENLVEEAELTQAEPSVAEELSVLEKDLQGFLARNLHSLESGLKRHPEYDLEQYQTDVGYIDLLCQDSKNNLVVVEIKAGTAGDSALGQILGYLAWMRDNFKDSTVRGIIVCRNPTDRLLAAAKDQPGLSIKRFSLSFSIEDAN